MVQVITWADKIAAVSIFSLSKQVLRFPVVTVFPSFCRLGCGHSIETLVFSTVLPLVTAGGSSTESKLTEAAFRL